MSNFKQAAKLVPKLRFPEFSDEWQTKKLGDFAKICKGKNVAKSDIVESGNIYAIRYGELYTKYTEVIDNVHSKTNLKPDDLVLSEINDVIIPASGESSIDIATASCVMKNGVALGGDLNIIRTKQNGIFLSYNLNNANKLEIAKMAQGNSVVHLYPSQINSLVISLPSIKEQEKIAGFLTVIDEKINILEQKLKLMQNYKKGLMQQIFSQKLRFKNANGQYYPAWQEKFGNQLFESITERNNGEDLPILAITQENGAIPRNEIDYDISVTEASIANYKIVRKGDFIISLRSFQGGIEYSNYDGVCSPAYIVLRRKALIDERFYKDYLKTKTYIQRLTKKLEGIRDGKMISYKYFSEVLLPYPISAEQENIGNFISAIDDKIDLEKNKLTQAKQFKESLLQRMFV